VAAPRPLTAATPTPAPPPGPTPGTTASRRSCARSRRIQPRSRPIPRTTRTSPRGVRGLYWTRGRRRSRPYATTATRWKPWRTGSSRTPCPTRCSGRGSSRTSSPHTRVQQLPCWACAHAAHAAPLLVARGRPNHYELSSPSVPPAPPRAALLHPHATHCYGFICPLPVVVVWPVAFASI
jgi:hypothetical protein